jgi:hypothetical protein
MHRRIAQPHERLANLKRGATPAVNTLRAMYSKHAAVTSLERRFLAAVLLVAPSPPPACLFCFLDLDGIVAAHQRPAEPGGLHALGAMRGAMRGASTHLATRHTPCDELRFV